MSRYNELLDGYLRDSLSESELQEFFQLVEENDQLPDESMIRDAAFDAKHEGLTDREQRQRMLLMVQQTARAKERRIGIWRWTGAAAAVVVLAVTGIFLLKPRHSVIAKTNKTYKNDVAPGKEGAILQLADGSQIVLDSTGNGEISRQGGARVIKKTNGQLVYEAVGKSREVVYNTLTTAKGKQFRMTLPDGTMVWLNAFSSLHYPTSFTGPTRTIEITGEVYFEVAPDASKPFIVRTGKEEITVLGTHFNINSYEDEPVMRATLLEGAIRVGNVAGQVSLRPGQQASIGRHATRIDVAEVNTEDVVAWKNGFFHFDNADIQTVMRQIARWYDVEVKFDGVAPTTGGDFKGDIGRSLTLSQVLKILQQTRVHYRIEEDKRIVIYQ
ncbi:MAG TPA: FecR domain-containing protein [Puia sp.]|nr:FecR domain-containing protein [Puia sp.]